LVFLKKKQKQYFKVFKNFEKNPDFNNDVIYQPAKFELKIHVFWAAQKRQNDRF
jgi:hypothetical protein